jgi:hypothetical protein
MISLEMGLRRGEHETNKSAGLCFQQCFSYWLQIRNMEHFSDEEFLSVILGD